MEDAFFLVVIGVSLLALRGLLHGRNARRAARGEPPLDVEAEVSDALREM